MTEPVGKSNMLETEEELDLFLDKIKNEYKDGWTEENWEEEMEKHPFFMTKLPEDSTDLPPAVEALRQVKWDADDGPKEKATKLKDEGNLCFKAKNYKSAITSYTLALKEDIKEEKELLSVIHQNRAAAHFHLQNYRSSLNDSVFAVKFNPKNVKAILRCAEACHALKLYSDCINWCEKGLNISDDPKLRDLISKSETARKALERDKRKKETVERKKTDKQIKICNLIKSKGIRVQEKEKEFLNLIENPMNPNQKPIQLSEDGTSLIWPVVFLYPEYGQTDFIEAFEENSTFNDHLNIMFEQSPDWDTNKQYTIDNLQIYYENRDKHKLVKIKKGLTLIEALKLEGFVVQLGTPSFLVMAKKSSFEKLYLEKYNEMF